VERKLWSNWRNIYPYSKLKSLNSFKALIGTLKSLFILSKKIVVISGAGILIDVYRSYFRSYRK
jgi:hypothetical protein